MAQSKRSFLETEEPSPSVEKPAPPPTLSSKTHTDVFSAWKLRSEGEFDAVVAIDFGSSGTGMVIGLRNQFTGQVCIESPGWDQQMFRGGEFAKGRPKKVPTCVLCKPNGDFYAFGERARTLFKNGQTASGPIDSGWLYFSHFKMSLARERGDEEEMTKMLDTLVESKNGKCMTLRVLLVKVMSHLKELAMGCLRNSTSNENQKNSEIRDPYGRPIEETRVRWVITVPSIWSESAKQSMRKCADESGMKDIVLLYEPEAAAIAIHAEWNESYMKSSSSSMSMKYPIEKGDRYMIVDCGGGTIDMVTHEWRAPFEVKELIAPEGGPWGSKCIDDYLISLITDILTEEVVNRVRLKKPSVWALTVAACIQAKEMFHARRRHRRRDRMKDDSDYCYQLSLDESLSLSESDNDMSSKMHSIALPSSLVDMIGERKLRRAVRKYGEGIRVVGAGDMILLIPEEVMRGAFDATIQPILDKLSEMLKKHEHILFHIGDEDDADADGGNGDHHSGSLKYVCLVGGFAESMYLEEKVVGLMNECAPNVRVFVMNEPSSAVMRGAASLEHIRTMVEERILRQSYGFVMDLPLSEVEKWENPPTEEELIERIYVNKVRKGRVYVRNCFKMILAQGSRIRPQTRIERRLHAQSKSQECIDCSVYVSDEHTSDHLLPMTVEEREKCALNRKLLSHRIPEWFDRKRGRIMFEYCMADEIELRMSVTFSSPGRDPCCEIIDHFQVDHEVPLHCTSSETRTMSKKRGRWFQRMLGS